jgi:hypothetical protein
MVSQSAPKGMVAWFKNDPRFREDLLQLMVSETSDKVSIHHAGCKGGDS